MSTLYSLNRSLRAATKAKLRAKMKLGIATAILREKDKQINRVVTAISTFKIREKARKAQGNLSKLNAGAAAKIRAYMKKHGITTWYKWTTDNGRAPYAYSGGYKLPIVDGKPGPWHVHRGKVKLCSRGYHACKKIDISRWHNTGRRLFEVQVRGNCAFSNDKAVFQQLRFVREIVFGSAEYKKLTGSSS